MPARNRLTSLLAAMALAAAFGAAGCGGDDEPASDGGGGGQSSKPASEVVASGDPAAGEKVFSQNCAACHGADGGGGSGPNLHEKAYTDADRVVDQIRNGGGGMPPFGDQLSEQELADVAAHVTKDLAAK